MQMEVGRNCKRVDSAVAGNDHSGRPIRANQEEESAAQELINQGSHQFSDHPEYNSNTFDFGGVITPASFPQLASHRPVSLRRAFPQRVWLPRASFPPVRSRLELSPLHLPGV